MFRCLVDDTTQKKPGAKTVPKSPRMFCFCISAVTKLVACAFSRKEFSLLVPDQSRNSVLEMICSITQLYKGLEQLLRLYTGTPSKNFKEPHSSANDNFEGSMHLLALVLFVTQATLLFVTEEIE